MVAKNNRDRKEGITKKMIRSKILRYLKTQKEEDRNRKSSIIKNKLFRTLVFKKAKRIMFYISFGGEVNTREMIEEAYNLGKTIAVPYLKTHRIIRPSIFHHKIKLTRGLHGTHEPAVKRSINLRDIDLVIVPGLAFDKKGNRLGRGKGCYDYFLKRLPERAVSVGLAFDFQIFPSIPLEPSDVKVGKVISA